MKDKDHSQNTIKISLCLTIS